ncbi:CoB--CoM heterodisulfide reductase subunit C [Methanobrevibacter sp.]|uniref:CoB--CoM heterodisulfide reductase subunit C n=1 Tax=Methanobrevibacter sp. TaxID=66852 RepID=UPI003D7E6112
MSIINRLKSLFKGNIDNEETDINNDVSNTSNDVKVTSSKMNNTVSSKAEDSKKDLTFRKDIEIVEDSSEEIVEKVEASEEATLEEPEVVVEEVETIEDEEETTDEDVVEEVEENSNDKDKKRDTMTLLTDKELLNDSNRDPDFTAEFIDSGIETVKHCFQCGTCSGSCPSGRRTPYKVRQIVRKCLLGLKEEVISDDALWMCTTCYTCQERCLRSVKIVEIIKKARNIAAHAGYMAKAHKMTGVFVLNTGHAVPINDDVKALRAKIGLSEVPPTTHAYPEALAEVQKLCKLTAFDELIGYDEATGGLKE